MSLDQYLTAANIIETLVKTDEKANELLTEAIGYLNRANSYHDTENFEAQQFHGYYCDTMRRCSRRITALTGLDKMVIRRALVTVVEDTL